MILLGPPKGTARTPHALPKGPKKGGPGTKGIPQEPTRAQPRAQTDPSGAQMGPPRRPKRAPRILYMEL